MRIVVALGGNALLRRGRAGATPRPAPQRRDRRRRDRRRSPREHEVVVTHGNGPQVGLLALQSEAYRAVDALPARRARRRERGHDRLPARPGARATRSPAAPVATLLTQVIVDARRSRVRAPDEARSGPSTTARPRERLAAERGWTIAPRRPRMPPRRRLARAARRSSSSQTIRLLVDGRRARRLRRRRRHPCRRRPRRAAARRRGRRRQGPRRGAARRRRRRRRAAAAHRRRRRRARLRHAARGADRRGHAEELLALGLPAGSMGPKVEAAAWFAEETGGLAAIGAWRTLRRPCR